MLAIGGFGFPSPVPTSPQDGVWVRGLYLEGAGWDRKSSCLVEAEPMQLVCLMPTIHFRPTESRKKSAKGGHPLRPASPPLPHPSCTQAAACCPSGSGLTPVSPAGMYSCPCYYYTIRAGNSDRASFVIGIDLRCGSVTSDHWIKRGTALLMNLDN